MSNFLKFQYGLDKDCRTPASECHAKGGPSECRWHSWQNLVVPTDWDELDGTRISDFGKREMRFLFDPAPKKDLEFLVGRVKSELARLQSAYPNMAMPKFRLFCGKPKSGMAGGCSELDHIYSPEAFICIGNVLPHKEMVYSYCHKGVLGIHDIIRHEIGHVLTTRSVSEEWNKLEMYIRREFGIVEYNRLIRECVSDYAAESDWFERVAEIFSIYTGFDDSKKQRLDYLFSSFVEDNMTSNGVLTMDSSNLNNDSVIERGDYIVIKAYHPEPFPIERPPQKDGYHYDAVHGEFVPIEEWKERFFEIRIPKKEWEESEKRLMRKIEWMKKNGKYTLPERMRKIRETR